MGGPGSAAKKKPPDAGQEAIQYRFELKITVRPSEYDEARLRKLIVKEIERLTAAVKQRAPRP